MVLSAVFKISSISFSSSSLIGVSDKSLVNIDSPFLKDFLFFVHYYFDEIIESTLVA